MQRNKFQPEMDQSWKDDPNYWLAKAEGAFCYRSSTVYKDFYHRLRRNGRMAAPGAIALYEEEYAFWNRTMWLRLLVWAQVVERQKELINDE